MGSKLEDVLASLEALAGRHAHEPGTVANLDTAAKALHFILHIGRTSDFWAYARAFNTEAAWPRPQHSFTTREDALSWLRAQPTVAYETVLEVAGSLYNVTRVREMEWVFIRFPSLEELGDSQE